jgi:truncated hemoglobin YjbI
VPPPYHGLLVHEHHMTVTVEAHHGDRVDVRVLDRSVVGDSYARKILLVLQGSSRVVQFGIMRVHLQYCSPEVRAEIVAAHTPLGRILIEHDVLRRIEPTAFLRVVPSPPMMAWFGLREPLPTYGRLAYIHCTAGRPSSCWRSWPPSRRESSCERSAMRRRSALRLSLFVLLVSGCVEGTKPTPLRRVVSLYDRLGGEGGIANIVDAFAAAVAADERLPEEHRKPFRDAEAAGLKKKLVEQLGELTGGPQKYTGKDMKAAHAGLGVTNAEFDAVMLALAHALDQHGVAAADRNEITARIEQMRPDIVEKAD